jgi:hypothetical protein
VFPALAFSPSGGRLLSGSADKTALVWDVSHLAVEKRLPALSDREMEELWVFLAGSDAVKAYQAIQRLALVPDQALPWLSRRLSSARLPHEKRVRALLADLDSNEFAPRNRAEKELERLGDVIAPVLIRFLADRPSLEVRRRVERLLRKWQRGAPCSTVLREIRCVEVLEQTNTSRARELLQALARGVPELRLTREAKEALARQRKRP